MESKEPFDFSSANLYVLLHLDADYPDKTISFTERYMHWRRIDSVLKCFQKEIKKRKMQNFKILDIGCGNGYLDFKLKDTVDRNCKLQITGIDSYKPAIDFANTRKEFLHRDDCHFELMDACELSFENDLFDVVICSEVLEHLKEPRMVIKEIYRVLKKDGLAIITTPNKREGVLSRIAKIILRTFFNFEETKSYGSAKDKHHLLSGKTIHHISVKNHKEWTKIFNQNKFSLQKKIGTGGMLYNYKFWEAHRILFGLMVIFDSLLEYLPFSHLWSEILLLEIRKS